MLAALLLGSGWMLFSRFTTADASRTGRPAPREGFPAPDFTLELQGGGQVALSELRGQVVVLNLWATWCPPCRAEMQTLETVYNDYEDKGFTVLAVNMTSQDDPGLITPFVEERGLTYPVLLDDRGDVARAYQMKSLPSSFFINRDGTINEVVIGGPMAEALLRTRIEEIIK